MTLLTRASVLGSTRSPPLITRDTVVVPTPARAATSLRVGRLFLLLISRTTKLCHPSRREFLQCHFTTGSSIPGWPRYPFKNSAQGRDRNQSIQTQEDTGPPEFI